MNTIIPDDAGLHGAAADLGIPVPGSNYANRRFCHDSTRGSTNTSAIISVLIGGSPVGTAGGMKTVTIAVLLVSMFATIGSKEDAELLGEIFRSRR